MRVPLSPQDMASSILRLGSFQFSPTSHKHQFYVVKIGVTRLNMMVTKYDCHDQISPHASFCNNCQSNNVNKNSQVVEEV